MNLERFHRDHLDNSNSGTRDATIVFHSDNRSGLKKAPTQWQASQASLGADGLLPGNDDDGLSRTETVDASVSEKLQTMHDRLFRHSEHEGFSRTDPIHIRSWQKRLAQVDLSTQRARAQLNHLLRDVEAVAGFFTSTVLPTGNDCEFSDKVRQFARDLNDLISSFRS